MICRRCFGRKSLEGIPCFQCLGKGEITISEKELDEYFSMFRPQETEVELKNITHKGLRVVE
jgi:hypothetical protein